MEKINYSLAHTFCQWLLVGKNSSELEQDKITYSTQLILNDGEKILLIGIFFSLIGKLIPYLICAVILGVLRMYSGGIHMNTFWSCFLVSFLCFFAIVFLGEYLIILPWQRFILFFADFLMVIMFAPLPSKKHLICSETQRIRKKICSCIVLVIVMCIGMLSTTLSNYITWIVVIQMIEIAGKLIYLKKEGVNQNEKHEYQR